MDSGGITDQQLTTGKEVEILVDKEVSTLHKKAQSLDNVCIQSGKYVGNT